MDFFLRDYIFYFKKEIISYLRLNYSLTERQCDILMGIALSKSATIREACKNANLSVSAGKFHLTSIYRKLGVNQSFNAGSFKLILLKKIPLKDEYIKSFLDKKNHQDSLKEKEVDPKKIEVKKAETKEIILPRGCSIVSDPNYKKNKIIH